MPNFKDVRAKFLPDLGQKWQKTDNIECLIGTIALSYPPIVIDDSSWKNAAESFAVALTLTLGGYESAIAPNNFTLVSQF